MSRRISSTSQLFALYLGLLLVGCTSDHPRADQFGTGKGGQGIVAVQPNVYVDLTLPTVVIQDGVTTISGDVRRKPGIRWTLVGRVDIEFIAANGQVLDGLPALIRPGTISMDPGSPSIYSTSYGYVPPAGSTIRVRYIDANAAAQEDMEGNDFSGPADGMTAGGNAGTPGRAVGGGPAAGTGGNHGGDHYGLGHHGGGFGGSFGHM